MTHLQKDIISKLIVGHYIKVCHGRDILYRDNAVPVLRLKYFDMKKVSPLLKKDRKGRMTANLSIIRQLHGNCIAKRIYKGKVDLQAVKQKVRRRKDRTDENVLTLF